jgi:spore germination protein YaaH
MAELMAWLYPTQNDADNDFKDGRVIQVLKPEYFTLSKSGSAGTLYKLTVASGDGQNAYSAGNVADVKAYSTYQYVTVSSNHTNMATLLANSTNRANSITTLVDFCVDEGFTGVELDWEGFGSWTTGNRDAFYAYVEDIGDALHAEGKKLMIDLPPIGDLTMQGYYNLTYEAFNTMPVDFLCIMAYDYQYDYGGGESVAPVTWVQNICDWAKTKITDDSKIVIGLASYGYHATTGGYSITIDTKLQSSAFTGYSGATRNADHEMGWVNGGISYKYQDTTGMDLKRAVIEAKGISYISVWHLGDNDWFTETPAVIPPPTPFTKAVRTKSVQNRSNATTRNLAIQRTQRLIN